MLTIEYGKVEKVADDLEKTSFVNGRITLLKTTLSSLPIYYLSASVIPREVQCSMESADFLWGGSKTGKKIHLVGWEIICSSFKVLNKALLQK